MTGFDDDQVFKYLGKYQLDTKLALLSQQVIKDSQSANPALEKQSQYWSFLHTSWPEHLLALFKQPDLPLLDSQDILQINASYNTVISRTNSQREHHHADMKTQQSEICWILELQKCSCMIFAENLETARTRWQRMSRMLTQPITCSLQVTL